MIEDSNLTDPSEKIVAYENKRRAELLDEAFAFFFDYDYVTPEKGYEEIKESIKGWRDYYSKYVDKANKLLKLLEQADESKDSSNT